MNETASAPLSENSHVKELLSILNENGRDASGLTALLKYVDSMENQLHTAVGELSTMRQELSTMRDERDHPVRTALQNAANSLETTINETQTRLEALKEKIIDGCKNAVSAFKQKGISALNGIAKFFRIKPAFESLRSNLQNDIKRDQSMIAKIEKISTRYHTAGTHLRNVGRALRGKEPVTAVKPNGKLAKLAAAPFRTEMKCLTSALRDAEKAIAALERLDSRTSPKKEAAAERGNAEQNAPKRFKVKVVKRAAPAADQRDDKPSVHETMKRLKVQIAQQKKDAPAADKTKHIGAEL